MNIEDCWIYKKLWICFSNKFFSIYQCWFEIVMKVYNAEVLTLIVSYISLAFMSYVFFPKLNYNNDFWYKYTLPIVSNVKNQIIFQHTRLLSFPSIPSIHVFLLLNSSKFCHFIHTLIFKTQKTSVTIYFPSYAKMSEIS